MPLVITRGESEGIAAAGKVHRVIRVYDAAHCYLQPHDGPPIELTQHVWKNVDGRNDLWLCVAGKLKAPGPGLIKIQVHSKFGKQEMPVLREEVWDPEVNGPLLARRSVRIGKGARDYDPAADLPPDGKTKAGG